jgi:hypothetical protein
VSLSDILFAKTGKGPRKGSLVDRARAAAGVTRSLEWRRVADLPRRRVDLSAVPDLTPIWLRPDSGCPGCDLCVPGPVRLRPVQCLALLEAERCRGLFGSIGVGEGKELVCLLLPDALQARRAVILTEPRLKSQALEDDIPRYGRHFELPLDRLTVVSYAELSGTDSGDVLERLRPDVVVANEAHNLRNREAARTKRMRRHLEEHRPVFCPLSGSFTEDDPSDYADLLAAALPGAEPFPRGFRERDDWSRGLSAKGDVRPGALLELCGPSDLAEEMEKLPQEDQVAMAFDQPRGREVERELARRIFARRLAETPGVVCSQEGPETVGASLVLTARRPEVPAVVREVLERVERLWRIDDEDLEDAMAVARVRRQLACGFYYRWVWPGGVKDEEWISARSGWFKVVAHVLRYQSGPSMDSPAWVERAAEARELRKDHLAAWDAWLPVRDRYRPHPPVEAVWLSDAYVEDCLRWLGEQTDAAPAILWVEHVALIDALRARGAIVFGGGDEGDEILRSKDAAVVASMTHATGKNLQRFSRNRVTTAPASRIKWQQLLGRTHRRGQRAGSVECEVDQHDDSLRRAFASALVAARAAEQAGEGRQRLTFATRIGF